MVFRSSTLRPFSSICVSLFVFASCAWSQTSTAPFADGPLQDVTGAMNNLARLKIENRGLAIHRNWGRQDGNNDRQDLIDIEFKKLLARGFDDATAAQLAERIVQTARSESPFSVAFFALSEGRSGSMQRTTGRGKQRVSFRNSKIIATGEIEKTGGDVRLHFVESTGPKREIELGQSSDGSFKFKYSGEDFLVELVQKRDGGIELVRMLQEEKESYQAFDFIGLRNQHPKLINDWLLPLMKHVGISVPMLADDREIVDAVFAKLTAFSNRSDELERLIKQLDSDDYNTRTVASEKIMANRNQWKDQIEKKLESRRLSIEARVRLRVAIADNEGASQVDQLIRDQDLLNSPAYLIELLGAADQTQTKVVVNRLQQITNLRYSRPDQWRAWLKEKAGRIVAQPSPPVEEIDE